ncbi:MAG: hybrid sensor histidine kinase/response regulator [Elainella sp. Prado103]|jgi:chemotaxis family two-component system sensor histidine kinase/response regulator PixL|nr:hybrid sensor histidine kinase/response regulator [Elainella sp. Prado103]
MVSDFRPSESYQFFLQEVPELLQTLEEGLLDLKSDHSVAKIYRLMRAAHSLKGGAACVGLGQIQTLAHQLETVLKACSDRAVPIDLALENLILQAFDCLKMPLLEELETGCSDDIALAALSSPVWQTLATQLKTLAAPVSFTGQEEDWQPPVIPLSYSLPTVDSTLPVRIEAPEVAHSGEQASVEFFSQDLFLQELRSGIHRLDVLRSQLDWQAGSESGGDTQVAAEAFTNASVLAAQLEIFRGLGELAQNDRLIQVAEQGLSDLQNRPDQVRSISQAIWQALQALPDADLLSLSLESHSSYARSSLAELAAPERRTAGWEDSPHTPPPTTTALVPAQPMFSTRLSPPPTPRLGLRPEGGQLEPLTNLVSELVTQDNRFRSQRDQQIETLEFLTQSFGRVRQLAVSLSRWAQQQPASRLAVTADQQRSRRLQARGQAYLQSTTQSIVEELAQFGEAIQDLMLLDQRLQQIDKQKQKTLKQVQRNLFQAQMLPVSELLNQFPRMVRDLAEAEQKPVVLELKGTQTLVDKAILQKLYDPLVHLVRNAFDHGIEPAEVRQMLGKPAQGHITIRAWHRGNQTYLEVRDDGQGIDFDQVRTTVIALNLIAAETAAALTHQQLMDYLFAPGFSTTEEVNDLSGRGMGLYAVQAQIQAMKGAVTVDSQPGKGTSFTLRLPLTLTITKLLVFSIQENLLAIPVEMLEAITVASEQVFQTEAGYQYYHWQGQFVPIYPESLLLTYHYPRVLEGEKPLKRSDPAWQRTKNFPLLLLSHGGMILALKVDHIVLEQDMMVKPFNDAIAPPACLSGCTILVDGRLVPVLDGSALVEKWRQVSQLPRESMPIQARRTPAVPKILIADDSLTIRHALSKTLAKAGYQVLQAKDGWEAIAQLRLHTDVAALICDIEMPRMNGLEVLSRCRQQGITVPVLMLTYRSSEKYRQLATQLGAKAYLTKPYLDKDLLQALEGCLTMA